MASQYVDAKNVALRMLEQLGERLPRPSDDAGLAADIQEMKLVIQNMSDDSIMNLHKTKQNKRDFILMNLYHDLNVLFERMIDAKFIADISLRMAQITLSNGLCCLSPVAFAHFAAALVKLENYALGFRLGTLSLRLLDNLNAQRYTSMVIAVVGHVVSWVAEPLQTIGESHLLGYRHGQRYGDVVSSTLNYHFYLQTKFFTGQQLNIFRDKIREFALRLLDKQKFLLSGACYLYVQAVALISGLGFKEGKNGAEKLPSWDELLNSPIGANSPFSLVFLVHKYTRSFLFTLYDEVPRDGFLDVVLANKMSLRPILLYGIFFEGLLSFQLVRQSDRIEYHGKGDAARLFFLNLSKFNKQNFENKYLILEAEMMYNSGRHKEASQLYEDAIRSANEHKLIPEEAIASELAGVHLHEVALQKKSFSLKVKSHSFFLHSIECYKKWGAFAISKRVEDMVENKFGSHFAGQGNIDSLLPSVFPPKGALSKKRHKHKVS